MALSRAILNVAAISKMSGVKTEELDKLMKSKEGEKPKEKYKNKKEPKALGLELKDKIYKFASKVLL